MAVAVACLAAFSAGCLPRGEAPAGRLMVADRSATFGAMVPPNGDGVLRVLFTRPSATDAAGADLYVASVDASSEPLPERLLIRNIAAQNDFGCTWKIAPCGFDAQGRISVVPNGPPPEPGASFSFTVVDPVTGEVTQVMPSPGISSASGQRSFVFDPYVPGNPPPTAGTLTDLDGHTTRIQFGRLMSGGPAYYGFIGEDFWYVDPNDNLIDFSPTDVAHQAAAGVTGVELWMTPDGPLMLLSGPTADPMVEQLSLREPVTGAITPLPFTGPGFGSWSWDYRFLFYMAGTFDEATMTEQFAYALFDRATGATLPLDVPSTEYLSAQWRPGHDQLWAATTIDGTTPEVLIITPGSPAITVPGTRFWQFSGSGASWISTTDSPDKANPAMDVGLADDPTGPVYPYNPPGTYVENQWELPDGRLVESVYTNDVQRADAIAVDPRTGDSRLLAERGRVAAMGQTRFMGMFHFREGRGDLTAVALDTGRSTVLAPEFTITAFAEPQGTDLLAPGARIAYQFQARTASPYDGIWVVNCP